MKHYYIYIKVFTYQYYFFNLIEGHQEAAQAFIGILVGVRVDLDINRKLST